MPHMLYPKSCYEGYEINDICEPEAFVLQKILASSLDCGETCVANLVSGRRERG